MWLNAQHVGNLLVRHALEHRQPEHLPVTLRQSVYHSHHLAQRDTSHILFLIFDSNQLCYARLFDRNRWQCLQMILAFRCHVPCDGRHPSLCPPDIAQPVERSEDNHESVVQHILHRLLVADIASAHARVTSIENMMSLFIMSDNHVKDCTSIATFLSNEK